MSDTAETNHLLKKIYALKFLESQGRTVNFNELSTEYTAYLQAMAHANNQLANSQAMEKKWTIKGNMSEYAGAKAEWQQKLEKSFSVKEKFERDHRLYLDIIKDIHEARKS